jgi:hypothetical protein
LKRLAEYLKKVTKTPGALNGRMVLFKDLLGNSFAHNFRNYFHYLMEGQRNPKLEDKEEPHMDPQIKEIRNRFVGFPSMMTSNPTFIEWKNAVHEAAGYISKKYFPESDSPLEEAALGPLLENARSWIATFGKGKEFPVLRRFYKTRLDTLYRVKSLSDIILPKPLRIFADKALKTYAWLKWPMKVYRSAKKGSPWKIAIEVGWTVSKKASLVYIYGKTFDKACKELERVYYQSREVTNAKKAVIF